MIFIIMREMDPFPNWEMEIFIDFHENEGNGYISQSVSYPTLTLPTNRPDSMYVAAVEVTKTQE